MKWLLALLLVACVPLQPYLVEYSIGEWRADWFGDGAPKRIDIVNPTTRPARVTARCRSATDTAWTVDVPAGGEWHALVQLLNRDEFTTACGVLRWEPL